MISHTQVHPPVDTPGPGLRFLAHRREDPKDIFSELSAEPVAAASLGQVVGVGAA